jgi:hypothetical protein
VKGDSKEMEKLTQPFNIEHELGKIKIHVPLVELVKNPAYHKQIEKFIHGSDLNNQPDTLNIHDEFPLSHLSPILIVKKNL